MDDLKIVFYLVVAIGWVIYNNYKKIANEAGKRDVRRPVSEIPSENWPSERPSRPNPPAPGREVVRQPVPVRPAIKRPEPLRKTPLTFKTKVRPATDFPVAAIEGGIGQPSRQVTFTSVHDHVEETEHPWLREFRSGTDWRKMLVGMEILQRPNH